MKLTKYLAVLCCGTLFAACENPIQDDLNVDNPENYTRIYTVNAVDDASKNTLSFPLERDTSLMVYANLSGIRNPGCDVTVKFRVAPELVDTYNQKYQSSYPMMLDGSYTIENLEAVIPNGKYISSPIRIAINSQAFDGVGVFLLPVRIENVTPDLAVNESLQTAYLRINGYYTENPFPRYDRSDINLPQPRIGRFDHRRRKQHLLGYAVAQRQTRPAALDRRRHGRTQGTARTHDPRTV